MAALVAVSGGIAAASPQTGVHASRLRYVPFPSPGLSNYDVAGRYPQLTGSNVGKVNAAIRSAFIAYEKAYAKRVRQLPPDGFGGSGIFDVTLGMTSASTAVVSTLIGLDTVFPGGNDGENFLSLTVTAPAGKPVTLTQLFTDKTKALAVLAAEAKRRVLAVNSCVATDYAESIQEGITPTGFLPTASNYSHWVLLPYGFRVAFDQGQLGAEACGWVSTLVPWFVLRPYLSPLGKQLVSGLRGETDYALRD